MKPRNLKAGAQVGSQYGELGHRHAIVLAVTAGALWLATVVFVARSATGENGAFRLLVGLMATWMFVVLIGSRSRLLLLSPLYLLGVANLTLFSLLPSIFAKFLSKGGGFGKMTELTLHGVGGIAEGLILQFAAFCLFSFALLTMLPMRAIPDRKTLGGDRAANRVFLLATILVVVLCFFVVVARWNLGSDLLTVNRNVHDGLLPAISVALAAVAWCGSVGEPRRAYMATAVILAATAALLSSTLADVPLYIAFGCLSLIGLLVPASIRSRGFIAMMPILIFLTVFAGVIAVTILRPDASLTGAFPRFENALTRKIFLRQGVPMGCLENIVHQRLHQNAGNPFYFVIAPVPRVLWPNKPSLSRGSEYSVAYCDNAEAMQTHNSESVTLLGEPIIEGGVAGLGAAQMTLAVILGAATFIGLGGGPVRLIGFVALLPWMIAFDQKFALYIANIIKMLIYMLPLLFALRVLLGKRNAEVVDAGG